MNADLLTYYNRELTWFKKALSTFADANPAIAGNLRISEDNVEDPHVSRLIESVAFLNARIQSRLDDDFPRVISALLEHLYPFYLAPKPSMLLAQMQPARGLDKAVTINPGYLVESEPVNGVPCRFQTAYPVTLTPLSIETAQLLPKPFNTPGADSAIAADSVLELKFSVKAKDFSLTENGLDSLAIHIKPNQHAWRLYDLLYKDCVHIVVASSDLDPSPSHLSADMVQPLGLRPEHRILPDLGDTESHYQLLGEYFSYNEKFLFFEISGLARALQGRNGDFLVYIYLTDSSRELEHSLNASSLALHCTPMINLFEVAAEPCKIKREIAEYLVVPESNAIGDMEVYAIKHVSLIDEGSGLKHDVPPYYGFSHDSNKHPVYWHSSRQPAMSETGSTDTITDFFLALTDIEANTPEELRQTLQIQCLCSNGNLPARLPYGGGQPAFTPVEPSNALQSISSISPPSTVRRLDIGHGLLWRLLSHLNLNFLSLVGGKNPAEQLREILRLYDHGDAPAIRAQINCIDSLKTRIISLPITVGGRPVICRGVDVEIVFESSLLNLGSALLFGNVLMRFLSMYVNLNSFVRLTAKIKGRDGIYYRWQPAVGDRPVI